MSKDLPNIGDIITSEKFAFGYYEGEDKGLITIDGTTTKRLVTFYVKEEERVTTAAKSGKVPPKTRTENLGAYDQGRGKSKFVVESANMQGGGTGHGPGDTYPDGWHVQARRLDENGTYDPNGEVICFYMSGCFTCMVDPINVKVVGKMQMRFV